MNRRTVAAHIAMNDVQQLTDMATMYLGPAEFGYIYEAYIEDVLETALMKAKPAARLAGGRGSVLLIQASATT
jgi:hypothetical protein